jgi:hypothetical protein
MAADLARVELDGMKKGSNSMSPSAADSAGPVVRKASSSRSGSGLPSELDSAPPTWQTEMSMRPPSEQLAPETTNICIWDAAERQNSTPDRVSKANETCCRGG